MTRIIFITFLLFLNSFFTSCEKEEEYGSYTEVLPEDTNNPQSLSNQADAQGNIYIINNTEHSLYLFNEDKILKEIPADSSRFLVYVPNEGFAKVLKIWKKADIADINNLDEDKLFRRWDVVLSMGTKEDERATWIIKQDGGLASGTITFNYSEYGENDIPAIYSVDVFLNNKNGAKITSLSPGTKNKKIGIEYGYHIIYYRYWYDDPNDTEGAEEIGWIEQDANGQNITVLINAANDDKEETVPININSPVGRAGKLTITNNRNEDLQIYASGKLIETLVISGVPTMGLSILEPNQTYTFDIPEDNYNLEARTLTTIETKQIGKRSVIMQHAASWILDEDLSFTEIEIVNNTNSRITIHDTENNYLGFWCEANETKSIQINSEIESLKAINWFGVGTSVLDEITDVWTIEELPVTVNFEYSIRAGENVADENESLKVEYYTKNDGWQTLNTITAEDVYYWQIFENEIALSDPVGTDFKIRFIQENNSGIGQDIFYIDDVSIKNSEGINVFSDDFSQGINQVDWKTLENISLNSVSSYCSSTPYSMMLNGDGQRLAVSKIIWN